MTKRSLLQTSCAAAALALASSAPAVIIYSDNFDDNSNTGWTYLDRSGGTAIVTTTGGSGTSPSFAEQNGQLEQSVANYTFPNGTGGPQLGSMALSASGIVGGAYTISVSMDSLENGNGFQDQVVVFGYTDEDNFYYIETIPDRVVLWSVAAGVRAELLPQAPITFSHDPTAVAVTIDSAAGDVTVDYGGTISNFDTAGTFAAGQNGVGSNNDAFAIDNYTIDQIPEPGSVSLIGLGVFVALRRRRA